MAARYPDELRRRPRSTVAVNLIQDCDVENLIDVHQNRQNRPRFGGRRKSNRYSSSRRSPERSETPKAILTKTGCKTLSRNDDASVSSSERRGCWRKTSYTPADDDGEDDVTADLEGLHIETLGKRERPKSALYEGSAAVTDNIFGFPSSRHKNSMVQKASQSIAKAPVTPKPSTSTKPKQTPVKSFTTPYAPRSKFKRRIGEEATRQQLDELANDLADSDYKPSDDSSESGESSDDMNVMTEDAIRKSIPPKSYDSRWRTREKISDVSFQATEYFQRQGNKSATSRNTLSKLKSDKFCRRELHRLLKKIKTPHAQALEELKNDYLGDYKRWMLAMSEGYNVLLYGVGSKNEILMDFQSTYLNERRTTVFVHGFFPGTTLKEIFEEIALGVLRLDSISSDPREAIAQIEQRLTPKSSDHLFILVSNIDGEVLRNGKIQSTLAELAALPKVHLVATCDHINSPLLWDQKKLSQFNFIWEDVTNLIPYTVETSYENSRLIENSGDTTLASLRNVFRSLNDNSRRVFKILLDYQLKEGRSKNYPGMSFSTLYKMCRESFTVSSDLALRTQLTEYLDHNLVKWKKDTDVLLILVDHNALEQFQAEIQ